MTAPTRTVVHLMRHGEVHNPGGVLYGRLPDYHLSELGRQMAGRVAQHLAGRDVVHVAASPLDRTQETGAPIAEAHGLPLASDERLIEAANHFEGSTVGSRPAGLLRPGHLGRLVNPFTPSWGEAYQAIGARMLAAVDSACREARGHEAVLVSHQLPIWTLRRVVEGKRLWHDPRRRQCALASLTTLTYRDGDPVSVDYTEPAADLIVAARPGAGA